MGADFTGKGALKRELVCCLRHQANDRPRTTLDWGAPVESFRNYQDSVR